MLAAVRKATYDEDNGKLLSEAQSAWQRYREAELAFVRHVAPLLGVQPGPIAMHLERNRVEELRKALAEP